MHELFVARGHRPPCRVRRAMPAGIYGSEGGVDRHHRAHGCLAFASKRLENPHNCSIAAGQSGDGKMPHSLKARATEPLRGMLLRVSPLNAAQRTPQCLHPKA